MAVAASSGAQFSVAMSLDANFPTADTVPKRHAACDECSESSRCQHHSPRLTRRSGLRKTETEMLRRANGLPTVFEAVPLLSLLDTKTDGSSSEKAYERG